MTSDERNRSDQPNANDAAGTDAAEEFVVLFAAHQRTIYLYLTALLPTRTDVDDVFQETSMVCWREFPRFEVGTNFGAWACTIAFNRVRAWRSKRSRESLVFSDEFIRAISDELIEQEETYTERLDALQHCVEKLPRHHRELVVHRYRSQQSIESIAERVERSTDAVYRMLSRIRSSLHECVNQTIASNS